MSRRLPDAETTKTICQYIRGGSFMWVSAVAAGISKGKYAEWMHGTTPEERDFQYAVTKASAEARVICENGVYAKGGVKGQLAWLMRGPGRERPGEEGWSTQVAVTGPTGGAVEQIALEADASEAELNRLTVDEVRAYRALREKMAAKAQVPAPEASDDGKV